MRSSQVVLQFMKVLKIQAQARFELVPPIDMNYQKWTEIKIRWQIRLGILVCENCESVANMIFKSNHDFHRCSGPAVMTWAVTFRKEPSQLWWINIQNVGRFSPRSNLKETQWLWNPEENTKTQKKCTLNVPSRVFERLLLTLHFFPYK